MSHMTAVRGFEYDREPHRNRFDHRPISPYLPGDKLRQHNSEDGFRFRDEFVHERRAGGDIAQRNHAVLVSDSPRWNPELASKSDLSSRDLGSNLDSYDQQLVRASRGNVLGERQRWSHSRVTDRDFHDSAVEMGNNDIDRIDKDRSHSGKHEYHSWDLGRYNGRGNRENNHENYRASRKHYQKSAFSRIQVPKPIHRSREDERLNYPGYSDSSNSRASNRGKDHLEEKRPGSPMELDVSFKSNALIAKAVSADISETSSSSRHREIRKTKESSKEPSASPRNNLNEGAAKLDTFAQVGSNSSTFVKDLKHSDEKTKASGVLNMQEYYPQDSRRTKVPTLKSIVEKPSKDVASNKNGINISSGTKSASIRKKKVVKRVISRPRSSALQAKKQGVSASRLNEPSGSDKGVNTMGQKRNSAVIASIVVVEGHDMYDSGLERAHSDQINSSELSLDLNEKETKPLLDSVNAASEQGSDSASKMDDINKFGCENMAPDADRNENVSEQRFPNGDPLTFGSSMRNGSQEGPLSLYGDNSSNSMDIKHSNAVVLQECALPVKANTGSCLPSSGDTNIPCCSVNDRMVTGSVCETDLMNSPKKNSSCDPNAVNKIIVDPCNDYVTKQQNNSKVEGVLKSETDSGSEDDGTLLSSEETRSPSDCCNHKSSIISDLRNSSTNVQENSIPFRESSVDIDQQLSAGAVTISPGSAFVSTDATTSMVCCDDDAPMNKKRKTWTDMHISGTNEIYLRPQDINNPSQSENPGYLEVPDSGLAKFNSDLEPTVVGTNGDLPPYGKRIKTSCSYSGFPNTDASKDDKKFLVADSSMPVIEVSSNHDDSLAKPEERVAVTGADSLNTVSLPCSEDDKMPSEVALVEELPRATAGTRDAIADDGLKLIHMSVDSGSLSGNLAVTDTVSLRIHDIEVMPESDQIDNQDTISSGVEKFGLQESDERIIIRNQSAQSRASPEVPDSDFSERPSNVDIESDPCNMKKDLLPLLKDSSSSTDSVEACTFSFTDELKTFPEKLFNITKAVSDVPVIPFLEHIGPRSLHQIPSGSAQRDKKECADTNMKSDDPDENEHSASRSAAPSLSKDSKSIQRPSSAITEQLRLKNQQNHTFSRKIAGNPSLKNVSSTHIGKARTWHRNDNKTMPSLPRGRPFVGTVPPQRKFQSDISKAQGTFYIRKGNSLVRNPASTVTSPPCSSGMSSPVHSLNSSLSEELKKSTTAEVSEPLDTAKSGGENGSCETLPNSNGIKSPVLPAVTSTDTTLPVLVVPSLNGRESTSDAVISTETTDISKASGNDNTLNTTEISDSQICPINNLESQSEPSDGDVRYFSRRIIYVKRKSNQLVAASNSADMSVQSSDKSQASSSDNYYKRSKNQLIRTSLESHIKQSTTISDDNVNSERQRDTKVASDGSFSEKHPQKVITKRNKLSKYSLVWTLCGAQTSRSDGVLLPRSKVVPHLFPWKRVTYWKSLMQNSTFVSNCRSLSTIRQLLLSRKRNTVYTRSAHGYSIRKSKVLSIGGSNLKWSKSMEKRSKKANEEATLAVAAAEMKKREKNGALSVTLGTENRDRASRERIFRIGPFRYKMDPSRRTLQRISDESPSSTAAVVVKDAKQSYVPKRLVIGSNEYVRIGNGNQLVRDPKKRTRVLASEKIRWSLHTARLRLAKKRKYCQFFTRFGKCNKDDGKCPYIHDPSKIAVCTKFLNGLCSNSSCKLTHKVIPERMPDCSYFLQGLCNNKDCPYRHVNVNPNASVCEGFLRGYCADGNECRKKHSYACPTFEATGTCPLGSKCRLHHPKSRSKGKKRKRSGEQGNSRGRYFGPMHIGVSEHGKAVSEKHYDGKDDSNLEGSMPEYISLEVSDEEIGEFGYRINNETTDLGSETTHLLAADDYDAVIKPLRIMGKELTT